ncbi:glycosyltransferase family 2 protein [Cytophagaceae bacterium DM2B3-1]|uniref:Glycosyltransferase family 2 protein n=1 Tax=Xanthocytophaga flava TaxID=3048013 RepID=A0ABT7CQX2_9BACT|nr:glycosyltransferase family 2 protein [Xanthocytophaga flavus]MDJ1473004.1 glycosyltransferase family 2 protein [Xanthocytophaga flavus]MDJ1495350.1 glycosyltransferase family 2 protein [Xanthocytophaga flavus]
MSQEIELTILMPCLNEAETLEICVQKAQKFLIDYQIVGEVIIADNGSTDGSQEIAIRNGAQVVAISTKGYGAALRGGIEMARGKYIIMGDSDNSYDFSSLESFVRRLREGYDLVMGNRFEGGIEKDAMPFLHRYLGNPGLSFIGRLFFRSNTRDFYCGLRGFKRDSVLDMNLKTTGMEFALEMVVKAGLNELNVTEVPTKLYPDGRNRPPHLRTWRDGWRSLRFFLLYSPRWLFLIPGFSLLLVGVLLSVILTLNPVIIGGVRFDIHTLLYSCSMIFIGFQCITFYYFASVFAVREGLLPERSFPVSLLDIFTLERGVFAGLILIISGIFLSVQLFRVWVYNDFGDLVNPAKTFRLAIPAVTLSIIGVQIVLYSFFYSILGLKTKP